MRARAWRTEGRALAAVLMTALLILRATCAARTVAATDARCTEILEQALVDKNPDTRKQAVIALSLVGALDPFFPHLEGMVHDPDVEVRLAAVASLAEVKNKRAAAALRAALDDDVPEVRFAAAKALWALHDPAGKLALRSILSGETKASSSVLSKQKRDAVRLIHTPRKMFLSALRYGVGFAPVPGLGQGIASMEALLTDPGVSSRATAALMLGTDSDPATVEALKSALEDKDWSVRAAAVHSLALRNNPALKENLVPALEDDKEAVRLRAAAAYLRLLAMRGGR